MPYLSGRRSRALDSDEDDSRPQTPASTAPNDRKRMRRTPQDNDDDSGDSVSEAGSEPVQTPADASPNEDEAEEEENKPKLVDGHISPTGHQPGAILRVKLTNFVTYSSAEFKPGPSLNMVIGPNGTGKSTLVCAICLGLGWGTQASFYSLIHWLLLISIEYLGRAKDAAEFVKHGCAEATIEIELKAVSTGKFATRRNPVFKRIIKRDGNKSLFFLNGNTSTGRNVQQLAKGMNIQIDNLCQFLPQDKVVEFAQMSPIEILDSTQRAAAPLEMIMKHQELKQQRVKQKELLHANRRDREHLDNLERRQEMSVTEVERMKERAIASKKLGWLEKLHPVPLYKAAKEEALEAKQRQKQLSAELKQLHTDSAPALRKVNAKEAYKKQVEKDVRQKQKDLTANEKRCDEVQKTIDGLANQMQECDNRVAAERKSMQKRKADLHAVRERLARLKNSQTQKPPEFDSRAINQEIADLRTEIRQLEQSRDDAYTRSVDLRAQGKRRQTEGQRLNSNLNGLETQSGQQEDRLQTLSRDTFTAWKWIQDNRDLFEQQVYGPPVVECSLTDTKMADAVESFLQRGDFLVITVQNQRDFSLLQKKLNSELNLHDIRIRTCANTNLEGFPRPINEDEMQQMGFSSYAIDHLVGPPTVLAMLCHEKRLQSCAIATRDLSQEQHDRVSRTNLSGYCSVSKGKRYQFIHRREYGDAGSLANIRDMSPATNWTKQAVDVGRKAALQRQIAEIKDELATIKEEITVCNKDKEEADGKIEQLQKSIKKISDDKDQKQKTLTEWNAIPTRIKNEEDKEREHQEFLGGVKERIYECFAERDQHMIERAGLITTYAAAASEVKAALEALIKAEVLLIEAASDFEVLADHNKDINQAIVTKTNEEQNAVKTAAEATTRARKLVKTCQDLLAEAKRLAENEGDDGFTELLTQMGAESWSTERLNGEIDAQKAQLELTEGGNANVIKEYEERAKQIEKLQSRLTDFNEKQAEFQATIKTLRSEWETGLEALVAKISTAFGESFARIGCAGQVAVHKASSEDPIDCTEENGGRENGLDFANWAVHISVKFRENEPLSLLDSHRQSGGERAVSTIFYLMALQSLSRAPFRVVDEINQGMDPRNERMVHGRMVDIATEEGGSQYFLITPKLLNGLKYKPGMTVLCIVSGENVPGEMGQDAEGNQVANPTVDFKDIVRKAKQLGIGAGEVGRRVDSGVGLGQSFGSDFSREGSRMTSVGA